MGLGLFFHLAFEILADFGILSTFATAAKSLGRSA
jgi:hypothetical protein